MRKARRPSLCVSLTAGLTQPFLLLRARVDPREALVRVAITVLVQPVAGHLLVVCRATSARVASVATQVVRRAQPARALTTVVAALLPQTEGRAAVGCTVLLRLAQVSAGAAEPVPTEPAVHRTGVEALRRLTYAIPTGGPAVLWAPPRILERLAGVVAAGKGLTVHRALHRALPRIAVPVPAGPVAAVLWTGQRVLAAGPAAAVTVPAAAAAVLGASGWAFPRIAALVPARRAVHGAGLLLRVPVLSAAVRLACPVTAHTWDDAVLVVEVRLPVAVVVHLVEADLLNRDDRAACGQAVRRTEPLPRAGAPLVGDGARCLPGVADGCLRARALAIVRDALPTRRSDATRRRRAAPRHRWWPGVRSR